MTERPILIGALFKDSDCFYNSKERTAVIVCRVPGKWRRKPKTLICIVSELLWLINKFLSQESSSTITNNSF